MRHREPDDEPAMIHSLRQLAKDTLVYGVGRTALAGIGLLVISIYGRPFSPAELVLSTKPCVLANCTGSLEAGGVLRPDDDVIFPTRPGGSNV